MWAMGVLVMLTPCGWAGGAPGVGPRAQKILSNARARLALPVAALPELRACCRWLLSLPVAALLAACPACLPGQYTLLYSFLSPLMGQMTDNCYYRALHQIKQFILFLMQVGSRDLDSRRSWQRIKPSRVVRGPSVRM